MKKFIVLTLAITMSMSTLVLANSPAKNEIVYSVAQTQAQTPLIAIDRETLEEIKPARAYAEEIGYNVVWNAEESSITFTKGENTFKCTIDSTLYYADVYSQEAKSVELETKTSLINGTAYIPASFAKMLFDVPVIDPMPPVVERPLEDYETLTPTLPVINEETTEINKIIIDEIETQIAYLQADFDEFITINKDLFTVTPTIELGHEFIGKSGDYLSVRVTAREVYGIDEESLVEYYAVFNNTTGDFIELYDILGENYIELCIESLLSQSDKYNYIDEIDEFVVNDYLPFYVNDNGDIVLVFIAGEITEDDAEIVVSVN